MELLALCVEYCASNPSIRSPHTERLLRTSVAHFGRFLGRCALVADLTDLQFARYIRHRRQARMADATIEREAAKLMTLARYAAHLGLVALPLVRIEKARVDTPVAFLRWEVRSLFRAARKYESTIGGIPGNLLLTALLATIWDSAERIGALCEVEWSDVNLAGRWITIRSRKNGGRTLTRRLRRTTARALRRLLAASKHGKPFGCVHRGTLYYHLERLLKDAGLPADRRHKFHCLRRSHASYLHAAGGDARESLDHSSEAITRVRYYDPRIVGVQNVLRLLFHPLGWWDRFLAVFGW